jgi:hypothetical protein
MNDSFITGYLKALQDFEELLDNAVSNSSGDVAPQHYDYELRDLLIMLREAIDASNEV